MKKHQRMSLFLGFMLLFSCNNRPSETNSEVPASGSDTKTTMPETTTEITSNSEKNTESNSSEKIDYATVKEVLDGLRDGPYRSVLQCEENIGLSDEKEVGVDRERFENENLYPIPEGTVYLAEDYGIAQDGNSNSEKLSLLLSDLVSVKGNKIIRFRKGIYPFTATVDVTGIEDLYLVGDETEFLYTGWSTYFEAKLCKNIEIQGISFDMKYSPTIAGTVKSVTQADGHPVVTLSVGEEFDLSNALYQNWSKKTCSYMECYFDDETGGYVPNRNGNLFYNSPSSSNDRGVYSLSYDSSYRELSVTLNENFPYRTKAYQNPAIGTMVSFAYTMYENHGFYFVDCENVTLENVNVYTTGGMGFRVEGGKDFHLNRTDFATKKGSARIMTCTADIIHTIALEGNLDITNCLLEGSHDDALNIKSFYTSVTSVTASSREIDIAQTQKEVAIRYEVGDTIEVYDPEKMELVDTYKILELVKTGTSYTLKVDKRPTKVKVGYTVGNASKSTKMTLDNCIIRNKRNRGILLQARDSKIINCTFQNVIMGAIQVLAVNDMFREAIVPQNIEIRNNRFLNNYNDLSVFAYGDNPSKCVSNTLRNVDISNNCFYNGHGDTIWILANGNTRIQHNLIHYTKALTDTVMDIETSESIDVSDNVLYNLSSSEMTMVKTTSCLNLTQENNEERKTI